MKDTFRILPRIAQTHVECKKTWKLSTGQQDYRCETTYHILARFQDNDYSISTPFHYYTICYHPRLKTYNFFILIFVILFHILKNHEQKHMLFIQSMKRKLSITSKCEVSLYSDRRYECRTKTFIR